MSHDNGIKQLKNQNIKIIETEVDHLQHKNGYLDRIIFKDKTNILVSAMYARPPFEQHCSIPQSLGCEINEDGYIKVDPFQKTTVPGVFASGDNTTRIRSVANAVSMGTTAGMMINREIVFEEF